MNGEEWLPPIYGTVGSRTPYLEITGHDHITRLWRDVSSFACPSRNGSRSDTVGQGQGVEGAWIANTDCATSRNSLSADVTWSLELTFVFRIFLVGQIVSGHVGTRVQELCCLTCRLLVTSPRPTTTATIS